MMTVPPPPTYAISYLRYSSRKQKKNSSYARQLEDTERYCKEHGLTLVERLEDLGISAWDGSNLDDRAALGGFLQRLETGSVPRGTVLICENLDRLSRANILDALELFIRILKRGIDIVTTMDGIRYSEQTVRENPTQLMISITILTRGGNESDSKSKRVINSVKTRREKIRNGEFAKFHCPSWLRHDGKEYHLIRENADKVKLIFELYVAGHGVNALIDELKRREVKPFTKTGRWNPVFLHELLQNPAAMGTFALIDPPKAKYYPAAVPEELFYKALDRRKTNRNFQGKRGTKEINIFGGLVKCYKCGQSMVKHWSRNGRKDGPIYESLICSMARTKECTYEFTNWNRFNSSFRSVFVSDHFERIVEGADGKIKIDKREAIRGRIIEVSANIQRVAGILARTDSAALEGQLATLESERKALETELEAETIRVKSETSKFREWAEYVKKLDTDFNNPEFRLWLRSFMRKTIAAIVCHAECYHVHFKESKNPITVLLFKEGHRIVRTDGPQYSVTNFK